MMIVKLAIIANIRANTAEHINQPRANTDIKISPAMVLSSMNPGIREDDITNNVKYRTEPAIANKMVLVLSSL